MFNVLPFFPLTGAWYPKHYENTLEFRKDMAIQSMTIWIPLLIVGATRVLIENPTPLLSAIWGWAGFMLFLRSMPILLSSYGSARVFRWNKIVYVVLAVSSIIVAFVL